MITDLPVLILSYVYLFGMLAAAEGLRRWRGYPVDFTRKVVHIAAGMTAWLLPLYQNLPVALIPPVSFIFINVFSYWRGTFQAMETGEPGNLGTIYFPLAFSILTWLLWDRRPLLVAAVMPMTWVEPSMPASTYGRRPPWNSPVWMAVLVSSSG